MFPKGSTIHVASHQAPGQSLLQQEACRMISLVLKNLLLAYELTCTEILVGHFHCDICFNQIENSLTSYDGSKFYFAADLPAEITKECILLISKMTMGSFEHYKFLELRITEKTD